ncbi:MAG: CHC2 zinc finger domain-containing protein [Anaerolineae bacterium]
MTATDILRLKQDHPIAEVVARFGIELRPSGRTFVGRCPFHADGGRPNFHVYPATGSWFCYRCGVGGDVIGFVRRMERCSFRQAVERIESVTVTPTSHHLPPHSPPSPPPRFRRPVEHACLAAAVAFYHHRLLETPAALAYWESRGLDWRLLSECRVGYATGRGLVDYLRQQRLPIQATVRMGLLRPNGREFFAGRLVIPEMRHGQPIWLIGRTITPNDNRPKYLGLPGPKPLLGWEAAARQRHIVLTEGVFDVLTLRQWGVPSLGLLGTHARSDAVRALLHFGRIYLAFDNDDAGRAATADLQAVLGRRAIPLELRDNVKDIADLALLPDGQALFMAALRNAGCEIEQEGE